MKKGITIRVRLEPALEEHAALLNPSQRRALARVYQRWARQLRVSAKILEADQQRPKPKVPFLKPALQKLN